MANTENIEAKLAAYVDGELDAAGRAEIEQYLTTNPQHRQLIDELCQAKNYLQQLPRAAAPVEVAEMISQQLERASLLGDVDIGGGTGTTHFSRWPQLRAIAAILILTVGLAGVLYYVLPSPKPMSANTAIVTPDLPRDEMTEVATARSAGPSVADADPRERVARGDAASIAPTGGPTGATPGADDRDHARTFASANALRMPAGGAGSGASDGGAVYLMVNTPDPASANSQVVDYFAANRISYEKVAANDTIFGQPSADDRENKKEAAQLSLDKPAAPNAGNLSGAVESLKDAISPTTSPVDKNDLAANLPAENLGKQQMASASYYKAKMTRDEATLLSETLSQPQLRQVAQLVTPESRQQLDSLAMHPTDDASARREKAAAEPTPAQPIAPPATNESSQTPEPAPAGAQPPSASLERGSSQGDVLAPGDTIRIRVNEPVKSNFASSEQTQTIDEDGYITLPNLGRVKAAGLTTSQLTSSAIPQAQERTRESQGPAFNLNWSIEKVQTDSTIADEKSPATQPASPAETDIARELAKSEPTSGPTNDRANGPGAFGIRLNVPHPIEAEKVDVVVIVQNVDGPANLPINPPTLSPISSPTTSPAPDGSPSSSPNLSPELSPDVSLERRLAEPASPATQPANASPSTHPTTAPER